MVNSFQTMAKIMTMSIMLMSATTAAVSTKTVNLKYLKGVPRLNTEYIDFYFFCNANGSFLQWQYNGQYLTGFQDEEVGYTVVVEGPINYMATLWSAVPIDDENKDRNSIIMVSFMGGRVPDNYSMTCSNGPHFQTVFAGPVSNVTNSSLWHDDDNSNSDIVLEYVAFHKIVGNTNIHLFVCGVNNSWLELQTNISSLIAFTINNTLGDHRFSSPSTSLFHVQGIFVARNPFPTTSVLFVDSDVMFLRMCRKHFILIYFMVQDLPSPHQWIVLLNLLSIQNQSQNQPMMRSILQMIREINLPILTEIQCT